MIPAAPSRVLVVDDEPANRRLIRSILASEGYAIVQADCGSAALAAIEQGDIDLVLLDVLMPGIDGIETCRRIRQDLQQPLLPVIMVTALADQQFRTRGKEAGADDYLTKPIAEEELIARVRNLLLVRSYYALSEAQRVRAEAEARRWKLVSEVAGAVATCRGYESLQRSIQGLLQHDLPIAGSSFVELEGEGRARALEVLANRRVVAVTVDPDDHGSSPFAPLVAAADFTHAAVLPVSIIGVLQGIFVIGRRTPFSGEELLLLAELAPHLANAVANVCSHLKAEELSHAKARLSMLLVHDLKNPLGVVKMNLDGLAEPETSPGDRLEMISDARSATDRVLGMVVDLLDIGLAEEGRLPLTRELVGVEEFVRAVIGPYVTRARSAGVTLECHIEADLRVSLDPKLLRRVLENLLNNAFRYVARDGRIEVHVDHEGDRASFRVCNDGPPIAPEIHRHLFEKYGVVHKDQGDANRGLGLYLCRLVVDGHGGTIAVQNRVHDLGVCFDIRLPFAIDVQERGHR